MSLRAESADVPLSLAVPVTAQLGNAGHAISARAVAAPPIRRDSIFAELPNRLDATDVHTALVSFVSALPERTAMNADLMAFYAGGGRHRVQMLEETSTAATAQSSLRVSFAIQLSKVDGLGREQKRILPVSMIVAKRDGDVNASAVTFGALRRP